MLAAPNRNCPVFPDIFDQKVIQHSLGVISAKKRFGESGFSFAGQSCQQHCAFDLGTGYRGIVVDVFDPGGGNDTLVGGAGSNIYHIGLDDGDITIDASQGNLDEIIFDIYTADFYTQGPSTNPFGIGERDPIGMNPRQQTVTTILRGGNWRDGLTVTQQDSLKTYKRNKLREPHHNVVILEELGFRVARTILK